MPVPASAAPVRTTLLRDTVHVRLRDAIVDGTLAPGEVVRDTDLATWLGVSRTPVREALLRLGETRARARRPRPLDRRRRDRPRGGARGPRRGGDDAPARGGRGGRPPHARRPDGTCARANARFAAAIDAHDTDGALAADDAFHAVAVDASAQPRARHGARPVRPGRTPPGAPALRLGRCRRLDRPPRPAGRRLRGGRRRGRRRGRLPHLARPRRPDPRHRHRPDRRRPRDPRAVPPPPADLRALAGPPPAGD